MESHDRHIKESALHFSLLYPSQMKLSQEMVYFQGSLFWQSTFVLLETLVSLWDCRGDNGRTQSEYVLVHIES